MTTIGAKFDQIWPNSKCLTNLMSNSMVECSRIWFERTNLTLNSNFEFFYLLTNLIFFPDKIRYFFQIKLYYSDKDPFVITCSNLFSFQTYLIKHLKFLNLRFTNDTKKCYWTPSTQWGQKADISNPDCFPLPVANFIRREQESTGMDSSQK